MIKTLLPSSTFIRQIGLAVLVLLATATCSLSWAEEAELSEDSAKRLGDIPYLDCFIRSADRYEVDVELAIAVAIVESSLNPDAISSSGAIGLMQIKWPLTAEHLGITQRDLLFDPCINIDAGVSYLRELMDLNATSQGEDLLTQTLASYRLGPTTIANAASLPEQAADYAEAIFKQRDILTEEDVVAEQSLGSATAEEALAEETAGLRQALESNEAVTNLNVLRENNPSAPENTFSNQGLNLADLDSAKPSDLGPVESLPQINPCSTASVRTLMLGTHNPTVRGEKFDQWLKITGINCTESQLITLRNSLPLWLGTALNSNLLGAVEILMEEKRASQ